MFPYKAEFDKVVIYSDVDITQKLNDIIPDVNLRLKEVDFLVSGKKSKIFICYNQKLFNFYARLAFQYPKIQGFVISFLNNFYLSNENIQHCGIISRGLPRYVKRQGNLGHVLAHELVHKYIYNNLGFWTNRKLPFWKNEGYAEYGAHIYHIKNDSTISLVSRIEELLNYRIWMNHDKIVKDTYQWELMIEYLTELQGYDFSDIMHDSVTLDKTYSEMIQWYGNQ
ncbi:MAG: hypothetical protein ACE5D6_03775 [Candidatus Zixiibacteriota bacterium]